MYFLAVSFNSMITSSLISTKLVLQGFSLSCSRFEFGITQTSWTVISVSYLPFWRFMHYMNFAIFNDVSVIFSHLLQYLPASKVFEVIQMFRKHFFNIALNVCFILGSWKWQFSIDEEVCFGKFAVPPKAITYQLLSAGTCCVCYYYYYLQQPFTPPSEYPLIRLRPVWTK